MVSLPLTPTNGVRGGRFQEVSGGSDSDNDNDNDNNSDNDSDELRFWLEASTFSNRGRSLRIVIQAKRAGWKPVPKHIAHHSLLIAQCGTGFQPAVKSMTIIRRQMLKHFPTVTKSTGFQPELLLTTYCSLLIAHYSLLKIHRYGLGWKPIL